MLSLFTPFSIGFVNLRKKEPRELPLELDY